MPRIGKLDIVVGLQDRASKALDRLTRRVEKSGGRLSKVLNPRTLRAAGRAAGYASVAVGGLATAWLAATRAAIKSETAAAHAAQKSGVSVDIYKAVKYQLEAVSIAGAKAEKIFLKIENTASQSATGLASYRDAYAALGVSVSDASGDMAGNAEIALRLSDAMDRAGQSTAALGHLSTIFGARDLAAFRAAFAGGREAVVDTVDALRALGYQMSNETAADAAAADQSLSLLSSTLRENLTRSLLAAAPALERMASQMTALVGALRALGDEGIAALGDEIKAALPFVGREFTELQSLIERRSASIAHAEERIATARFSFQRDWYRARLEALRADESGIGAEYERRLRLRESVAETSEKVQALIGRNAAAQQVADASTRAAAEGRAIEQLRKFADARVAAARDGAASERELLDIRRDRAITDLDRQLEAARQSSVSEQAVAAERSRALVAIEAEHVRQVAELRARSPAAAADAPPEPPGLAEARAAVEAVAAEQGIRDAARAQESLSREEWAAAEAERSLERATARHDLLALNLDSEHRLVAAAEAQRVELTQRSAALRAAAEQASNQARLDGQLAFLGRAAGLAQQAFSGSKTLAKASAAVQGLAAAVASFRFGAETGGPYLGAALAAASALATGRLISQIGGTTLGSSATTASTATPTATLSLAPPPPTVNAQITIEAANAQDATRIGHEVHRILVDQAQAT